MSLNFLARIDTSIFWESSGLTVERILNSVAIMPGGDQHDDAAFRAEELDIIDMIVTYGGENSSAKKEAISFTRRQIAQSLLASCSTSIAELLREEVGCWRQDLFDEISEMTV